MPKRERLGGRIEREREGGREGYTMAEVS